MGRQEVSTVRWPHQTHGAWERYLGQLQLGLPLIRPVHGGAGPRSSQRVSPVGQGQVWWGLPGWDTTPGSLGKLIAARQVQGQSTDQGPDQQRPWLSWRLVLQHSGSRAEGPGVTWNGAPGTMGRDGVESSVQVVRARKAPQHTQRGLWHEAHEIKASTQKNQKRLYIYQF